MLLTITTTATPATDLGFLLHKHPGKAQAFSVSVGQAHVFYPEATEERCTAALMLEVDPIALVRGRSGNDAFALAQYVNDRPYAASSMLAVAMGKVFRSAMAGRCEAKPGLADRPLPLDIHLPVVPTHGGVPQVQRLFEPLGWTVTATAIPLDPAMPQWGDSRYVDLRLTGELRLADALSHLYVLLPVLDGSKHYWVSVDEVDKVVRAGESWLNAHPARDLILGRYLANRQHLVESALTRLAEIDEVLPETLDNAVPDEGDDEPVAEALPRVRLADARKDAVLTALRAERAARVVDLGCGQGALLTALVADPSFKEVVGVDVSHRALEIAARRLHFDRMPDSKRERVSLFQSSLTYRDDRLAGYDAVVLMEVIEHIDPPRLPALVRNVFGQARPTTVIVTTPNAEHNVRYQNLDAGSMRHRDHRFEWTRDEFRAWCEQSANAHGYAVRYVGVGDEDAEVGPSTQMAVFTRFAEVAA